MVVLHSGNPVQAMNTEPAFDTFTFILFFLQVGHTAKVVSPVGYVVGF